MTTENGFRYDVHTRINQCSLFMFQLASSQPLGEETEVNPSSDEGEEDNAHKRASSAESQSSKKIKLVKKPEMTDLLRQMMTENRRTEKEAQRKVGFLSHMRIDEWTALGVR